MCAYISHRQMQISGKIKTKLLVIMRGDYQRLQYREYQSAQSNTLFEFIQCACVILWFKLIN